MRRTFVDGLGQFNKWRWPKTGIYLSVWGQKQVKLKSSRKRNPRSVVGLKDEPLSYTTQISVDWARRFILHQQKRRGWLNGLIVLLVIKQKYVICEIEDFVETHLFKAAWNTSIARIYYQYELYVTSSRVLVLVTKSQTSERSDDVSPLSHGCLCGGAP